MKIAIIGDSFLDEYVIGEVDRLSPEAPVPVLDVLKKESRGGGALNVANNLHALGIRFTLFTITSYKAPYEIVSPTGCSILRKTRYIGNMNYQLLRVDEPKCYPKEDLKKMIYPHLEDFDIIAFADYDKGILKEGKASMLQEKQENWNNTFSIVDSKKKDLRYFAGAQILKVNGKEWENALNGEIFPQAYVTRGSKGIDYFEYGSFRFNEPTTAKEIIDVSGAGDTVLAVMIYCLAKNITDPRERMKLANKAAGIKIAKFGTAPVSKEELFL